MFPLASPQACTVYHEHAILTLTPLSGHGGIQYYELGNGWDYYALPSTLSPQIRAQTFAATSAATATWGQCLVMAATATATATAELITRLACPISTLPQLPWRFCRPSLLQHGSPQGGSRPRTFGGMTTPLFLRW